MSGPALATPLLYAASGAALLGLAHRFARPLSRRAALLLLLLPLVFTGRALLTGRVYGQYHQAFGSQPLRTVAARYDLPAPRGIFFDLHGAIAPWHHAVRWSWAHHEWPLLDPFVLAGDPLAGSAQPAPYYPVNALGLLLPLPWALTFMASLQLLLAALGAFLWLRELGSGEEGALLAAAGWSLSAIVAFWIEWPLGCALSLVPLVLFACRRLARQPGVRAAGLLAAALTLVLLAGHPESVAHVVAVGLLVGVAEAVLVAGRRWRAWLPIAGWGVLAGAVALGLAALFLLPILDVLPQTAEWDLRHTTNASMHAAHPAEVALRWMGALLAPARRDSPTEYYSAYCGSLLWAPALYALWRGRGRARWLLAGLAAIGIVAGARVPGAYELLARLPLLSLTLTERLVVLTGIATALLAGLGVDAWLRRGGGRDLPALAGVAAAGAVLAAFLVAGTPQLDGSTLHPASPVVAATPEATRAWLLAWAVPPALGALALLLGRRRPALAVAGLFALLVAQRGLEGANLYPALPADAWYPRVRPLLALPPTARNPYRVVGNAFDLIPNEGTLWEIEDPRGYQAIHHRRFAEVRPLWARPDYYYTVTELDRPFLALLNVRYALTTDPVRPAGWERVAQGRRLSLWRNPRALPRAFLPREVRLGTDGGTRLAEMGAATDFAQLAWIEPPGAPAAPVGRPVTQPNGAGSVAVRERGARLELVAALAQPAWVVVTQTAWRGWRATDGGGHALPVGVADHAFLAVRLPAGASQVELAYRPRAFTAGLTISAATCMLLLGAALASARRRRRGEPSPDAAGDARRLGDQVAIEGDYQYRAFHAGPAPQRFWHRARVEEAFELLRVAPGVRVLDAGCGSGIFADMAARGGARVLAIDANPEAIAFGRGAYDATRLEFRQGLVDELDLQPASFDRIAFLEVIEHVTRAQGDALLARFRELLVPGGRVVLSTPNRRSLWPLLEWLLDHSGLVPRLGGEQHEVLYTRDELHAAAARAGLRVAEERMVDTLAPWCAVISERLARAVHRWEVRHVRRHGSIIVLALERPAEAGGGSSQPQSAAAATAESTTPSNSPRGR